MVHSAAKSLDNGSPGIWAGYPRARALRHSTRQPETLALAPLGTRKCQVAPCTRLHSTTARNPSRSRTMSANPSAIGTSVAETFQPTAGPRARSSLSTASWKGNPELSIALVAFVSSRRSDIQSRVWLTTSRSIASGTSVAHCLPGLRSAARRLQRPVSQPTSGCIPHSTGRTGFRPQP